MNRHCCATGLCALHLAHGDCSGVVIYPGCVVEVRNHGHQETVGAFVRWVLEQKGVA